MRYLVTIGLLFLTFASCKDEKADIDIPSPKKTVYSSEALQLSKVAYYDKVLGALVGSAIGDAMGASTEMWRRKDIQLKYGYIKGFTPAIREQSPEGTWGHNLTSGATTDDTRWKFALVKYLSKYQNDWSPEHFADFILDYYSTLARGLLNDSDIPKTDFLDTQIEKNRLD